MAAGRGPGRDRPGRATGSRSTGPGGSPLDRHPGRTRTARTTVYRPLAGDGPAGTGAGSERNGLRCDGPVSERRNGFDPNGTTPLRAGRLRPAAGRDTAQRVRVLERARTGSRTIRPAVPRPPLARTLRARTHHTNRPNPRRRVLARRRVRDTQLAPASPRSSLARSEGRAGLPAVAPGQRAWPRCQDVRRAPRAVQSPDSARRHLGKRGGKLPPHATPALGPAARESLHAAGPSPSKV